MIGLYYPHPPQIPAGFHNSLLRLALADAIGDRQVRTYGFPCGVNVTGVRNAMVEHFLATDAEWMLMLDCDMTFGHDLVHKLVAAADPVERPIVGGLYFKYDPRDEAEHRYSPHLYAWHPDGSGLGTLYDYPADTLLQVVGTGAGCLLMHRSVLEKIQAKFPPPWPWFAEQPYVDRDDAGNVIPESATVYSEDLTFCLRAAACEVPVFVHTGIGLGHIKTFEATEESYRIEEGLV